MQDFRMISDILKLLEACTYQRRNRIVSHLRSDVLPDPVEYVPTLHRLQLRPVVAPARHAVVIMSRMMADHAACHVKMIAKIDIRIGISSS